MQRFALAMLVMQVMLVMQPAVGTARAAEPVRVLPSETDPRIREFDEPHLAWLPDGHQRGQLLVFLPGTGGKPEKGQFQRFASTAAEVGYHVVALMYPDNIAAQVHCARSTDPDAYTKFRTAILTGGPIGPHRTVEPPDSIENRLEKLLVRLDVTQPGRGWGDFLTPEQAVKWPRIAVAGHSQGGGHAYMLGKNHELARVVMFGSPKDYSFHFQAPAKGLDGSTRTPLTRFYAYNHVRDDENGCTHEQQRQILDRIGLPALGVADVDHADLTQSHAHVLYTNADVPSGRFHGSVVSSGLPINPTVWKYMLTAPVD